MKDDPELEKLDITGNYIPDLHLKMLLVLMYQNKGIKQIEYDLVDPENKAKRQEIIDKY